MITTKQRATLRGMANSLETIGQIGKGGITDATVQQVNEVLTARELVKFKVLEASALTAREAADQLQLACDCDVVQVIGSRFVLYKKNPDKTESPKSDKTPKNPRSAKPARNSKSYGNTKGPKIPRSPRNSQTPRMPRNPK